MNLDNLNKWLTLIANIGVLIGIIVVAVQLQQTQVQMSAQASTTRTELVSESFFVRLDQNIDELLVKIRNGENLTEIENSRVRTYFGRVMRYMENLHYQHQLGVLDEEIWQSNLYTLGRWCDGSNPTFKYLFPDGFTGNDFRASFRELLTPPCSE